MNLKEQDVEPLAKAVLEVLEKIGLLCQNDEILKAIDKIGGWVDYDSQRAKFPKQLVRDFVEHLKKDSLNGDDFIGLIKLGNVLHPEEGVRHSLILTDVPPLASLIPSDLINPLPIDLPGKLRK